VHFLGHKPYLEMPDYLHGFDVCTVPFVLNRVTEATDPVKLYEYCSQGKPVVATNMPELARCGRLVYIAGGAEDFAKKLDLALLEQPDIIQRRIDFAAANTWARRYLSMDTAIRGAARLVSILLVSYNSAEFLRPCLDSVLENTNYLNFEIIAVDNGSTDGSAEILQEYAAADKRVQAILNETNAGFAKANNIAAGIAKGEFLVLLNADTIVPHGWLRRILAHLRNDSSIGMILPVTNWAGNEAKINVTYKDLASMYEFAAGLAIRLHGDQSEIGVAPLFCGVVPSAVWKEVGPLDERFGAGMFEDDDYSRRVRQAGYRVVLAEDSFVHHFGGGSFGKLPPQDYSGIFEENLRRFEDKWGIAWQPHTYRPGVGVEGGRFRPEEFFGKSSGLAAAV
jgi:GT2 family glycosyltransferase